MLVYDLAEELKNFSNVLTPQDRSIITHFIELALNNRAAIANAASLQPLEAMLLLVMLQEHKDNARNLDELRAEIRWLRSKLSEISDESP